MGDIIGREEGLETLGPLGRSEGVPWKFMLDGPILEITVYYDQNFLRGISFQCKRSDGTESSRKIGRTNVGQSKSGFPIETGKVCIDSNEKLESISALWDSSCLKSLTFTTNRRTYGPYGSSRSFRDSKGDSLQIQGRVIAGFYGHHAGKNVYDTPTAIGVYVAPRVIRGGGNQVIVGGYRREERIIREEWIIREERWYSSAGQSGSTSGSGFHRP